MFVCSSNWRPTSKASCFSLSLSSALFCSLHLIIELNQAKNIKKLLEEVKKVTTNGEGKVMKQTTSGPKLLRSQSAPVNKSSSN